MNPDSKENVNRVHRKRAVESSTSKHQLEATWFASSWEFSRLHLCLVQCVYLFIKVGHVFLRGGGDGSLRLQELPFSGCWTRGAGVIKNVWEHGKLPEPQRVHEPWGIFCLSTHKDNLTPEPFWGTLFAWLFMISNSFTEKSCTPQVLLLSLKQFSLIQHKHTYKKINSAHQRARQRKLFDSSKNDSKVLQKKQSHILKPRSHTATKMNTSHSREFLEKLQEKTQQTQICLSVLNGISFNLFCPQS